MIAQNRCVDSFSSQKSIVPQFATRKVLQKLNCELQQGRLLSERIMSAVEIWTLFVTAELR